MKLTQRLNSFIGQSRRVWRILRKPTGTEFKLTSKVSAVGILALGLIGFVIGLLFDLFG